MRVTVTNSGDRPGSTVVQIYVGDTEASVPRPVKELKTFEKVALAPKESRAVSLELPLRKFAFFDTKAREWRVEAGSFTVAAGFSAQDIRAQIELALEDSAQRV